MTEYIDREDVIDVLYAKRQDITNIWCRTAITECVEEIQELPSADVQPIVRCKDCKHFHLDYFGEVYGVNIIVAHEICDLWAGGCRTTQDTFCSNGVRKCGET